MEAFSINNTGGGEAARFLSNSTFASVFVGNSSADGNALRADIGSGGIGTAIIGLNYGTEGYAGNFQLNNADNVRAGLYARTVGTGSAADLEVNVNTKADALYARTTSSDSDSYAGYFQGNVNINGTLTKTLGSFKIDHPLDPANKYLYHSFVESPDMMNVYNGCVVLDGNGEAVVTLPDWFEALNKDFRYQLTAIGAPGPNLYVAEEIHGNQFRIAGGGPGLKVSWQVTGIRQDAYANAHRIPVEEVKPTEEQGTFLHPDEHGQPRAKSLDLLEHPLRPEAPSELGR
ncbi:hypothetical protein AMJ85_08840 [candidate division BRC1 bacterium SM23_51]|nr:MAG: hypothetical protein AMJ85_08840 [candidate division BRC1 bacterium SM23_51]